MELTELVSILVQAGMEPEQATALAGGSQNVQLTASGLIKILVVAQDRMTIELPGRAQELLERVEELAARSMDLTTENAVLRAEVERLSNLLSCLSERGKS